MKPLIHSVESYPTGLELLSKTVGDDETRRNLCLVFLEIGGIVVNRFVGWNPEASAHLPHLFLVPIPERKRLGMK